MCFRAGERLGRLSLDSARLQLRRIPRTCSHRRVSSLSLSRRHVSAAPFGPPSSRVHPTPPEEELVCRCPKYDVSRDSRNRSRMDLRPPVLERSADWDPCNGWGRRSKGPAEAHLQAQSPPHSHRRDRSGEGPGRRVPSSQL